LPDTKIDWKFKEARVLAGFTQAQLAKKLNVSRSTISRWERTGKVKISDFMEWLEVCNCQMKMILVGDNPVKARPEICAQCSREHCNSRANDPDESKRRILRIVYAEPAKECPFYLEHVLHVE